MPRIFLPVLSVGEIAIPADQAHHLRDVLRLTEGDKVEAFNPQNQFAHATIASISKQGVRLRIDQIELADRPKLRLTVASALPKGPRADWMIEKLSEIGVDCFIPLATERSVVLPSGKGKPDRWNRLAASAAEQSGRAGIMRIEPLTPLKKVLEQTLGKLRLFLSPSPKAELLAKLLSDSPTNECLLFVGSEGGWAENEIAEFASNGVPGARLTKSILRIETAAIAAAAIALSLEAST